MERYRQAVLLDRRLIERHLDSGDLTQQQLDDHLKSLPDVSKKAAFIEEAMLTAGTPPSAMRELFIQRAKERREARALSRAPMALEDENVPMPPLDDDEVDD